VALLDRLEAAERDIAKLSERIDRLQAQGGQSSRNSSKAPSTDRPKTRAQRRAEARAKAKEWARQEGGEPRKAGKQPGSGGAGRKLLPEDQIDEIVDHYPRACTGCDREFDQAELKAGGRYGRHQVSELPPTAVTVTEHRTHRLRCAGCKTKTAAVLPVAVGASAFGPRMQAAVVTLTARNRVSRRDMSELARELFGLRLSVGSVEAICQRAVTLLGGPQEALVAHVLDSPAVNIDETGWRTAGEQRTLWTATTETAAVFRVCEDRHRDRLVELIGAFAGIVCSDRWWAYDYLDPECRQACWEHVKRDFIRHSEGLAEQQDFGEQGLALTRQLFAAWRDLDDHHDRARLAREIKPIQKQMRELLEHAARKSQRTRRHGRFARNLLKLWPALWTFVTVEGVEPTNNAAERSLRGPVIARKLSHGTRSTDGERFVERALSASVTCRLQHRSLFAYLSDLFVAHSQGQPLPALA